jgi:hypothetical protein
MVLVRVCQEGESHTEGAHSRENTPGGIEANTLATWCGVPPGSNRNADGDGGRNRIPGSQPFKHSLQQSERHVYFSDRGTEWDVPLYTYAMTRLPDASGH